MRIIRGELARSWLGGAKILLDIALYVGVPAYREEIQNDLSRRIAAIPDRQRTLITIVAHSLGSVIAVDSLTNSCAWRSTDRVRLITLGSPIRRFFIRFFPGVFFAADVDDVASVIGEKVNQFTWINAFRRFDYIGNALRFQRTGLDLPTHQRWPLHAGYWGDHHVARVVVDGLNLSRILTADQAAFFRAPRCDLLLPAHQRSALTLLPDLAALQP